MELHFWNDTELLLTLYRLNAHSFESRPFVLSSNRPLVESLERITKQSDKWKVGEWELHSLLNAVLDDSLTTTLSTQLQGYSLFVREERENEWIDEKLNLKISLDAASDPTNAICENLFVKKSVDLLVSVVSAALKNTDTFAVLRLFDHVCPEILPVVKRLAAASELTILQTIFSYLMKLEIDGGDMGDLVLRRHEKLLRSFNTTVDKIEEQLCEGLSVKRNISKVLDIAAEWISSLTTLSSDVSSVVAKSVAFAKTHLDDAISVFSAISKCSPQTRPNYLKDEHVVLRLLIDRLTLFDTVSLANVYATPAFRTPVVAPPTPGVATPVVEDLTPKRTGHSDSPVVYSKFLNFDTPCTAGPAPGKEVEVETDENSLIQQTTPCVKKSNPVASKPRSRLTRKSASKLFSASESTPSTDDENSGKNDQQKIQKTVEAKRKRRSVEQPKTVKTKDRRKSEPTPVGQRKITSFFTGK